MKLLIEYGYILGVLVLFGCGNNTTSKSSLIDLSSSFNGTESIKLSDIAIDVSYIQLHTDSVCLLGSIGSPSHDINFCNDKILISDSKKIIVFDISGKYISKIESQGKGPGEYHKINGFVFIPDLQQVAIHSAGSRKVLFFSLDGRYIREISVLFWPTRMIYFSNSLVFVSPVGRKELTNYYALTVMGLDGSIINRLIYCKKEKNDEKKNDYALSPEGNTIYCLGDCLYFYERLYDTIWKVGDDFRLLENRFIFYGNERRPDAHLFKSYQDENSRTKRLEDIYKYILLSDFLETNRYIFFTFLNKGALARILYDKMNKNTFHVLIKGSKPGQTKWSLANDIDGGLPFWPMGCIDGSRVFSLVNPIELMQHFESSSSEDGIYPSGNHSFLNDFRNQVDLLDNPIIMIATLK